MALQGGTKPFEPLTDVPSGSVAGSETSVEILRTTDALRAVRAEWEDFLDNHAGDHDVQQNPFWILKRVEFPFQPSTPFVMILRDQGIRCVAPFFIMPRKISTHLGPLEIPAPTRTILRPFGDRIVHRRGSSETENVRLLLKALVPHTDQFDAIWLPEIRVPGDFWDTFAGGKSTAEGFRLIELHPARETVQMIDLKGDIDEYLSSWTGNSRRKRKSRLKKLEKLCGKLTLSVITEPNEMRAFLATADDIRDRSWKADVFEKDRWKNKNRIAFQEAMAGEGMVTAFVLKCGDRAIAYQLGHMYHDRYVADEIAFDNEFRAQAPGAGLMLMLLEWLCNEHGACRILLQPTDSELKRSFGNASFEIGRAVIVHNSAWSTRFVFGSQRFVALQHDRLSRLVKRIKERRRSGD